MAYKKGWYITKNFPVQAKLTSTLNSNTDADKDIVNLNLEDRQIM